MTTMADESWIQGEVSRYRGLIIDDAGDRLRISVRAAPPWSVFLTPVVLLWNAFFLSYTTWIVLDRAFWSLLWAVPCIVVGLAGAYAVMAGLLNRRVLLVQKDRVAVHLTPFPWAGRIDLPAGEVTEVYYERRMRGTLQGHFNYYDLKANTRDGRRIILLTHLDGSLQAEVVTRQVANLLLHKPVAKA